MKVTLKPVVGSIAAPKGFRTGGVFCDIKRLGTGKGSDKGPKRDLALIVSDAPCAVAGMFTTNQFAAAPVKLCAARASKGLARGVVVNSGNANACTGRAGMRDALAMADAAESVLGVPEGQVFVASTGRIGVPLPMKNVLAGITAAGAVLGSTPEHAAAAVESIMTSDTRPKEIAVEFKLSGKTVRIGGICKGAGMIQPGMSPTGNRPASAPGALHATMLGFITTDAAVAAAALRRWLAEAVALSFNRITVDGDMSTNDTVLVLANGLAGNPVLRVNDKSRDAEVFRAALQHVCLELAKKIVRDGEGVHRVVTVRVSGAKSGAEADAAARAVANSALVKTSWHGGDPNWGRIVDALGYSPATVDPDRVDVGYSAPGAKKILWSVKRGQPTKATFAALCEAAAPAEFDLHLRLNLGKGEAVMYAADLTEAYVDYNKGDVTDPTTLGG
jgi:glutamate N-acetyltransferase / amino-acid N-acetyltransferase